MVDFIAALLSFFIGAFVTLIELITSRYPQTFFLLKKSRALYFYIFIYGTISFLVMLGIESLIDDKLIKLEGAGISSIWVQAVVVGLATKALLHIRIFTVTIDSKPFPMGVETLVYMFEPWLLRKIELDEFNAVREFVDSLKTSDMTLDSVKMAIVQNILPNYPKNDKAAFLSDLKDKTTISECLELYLSFFGKKGLIRVCRNTGNIEK